MVFSDYMNSLPTDLVSEKRKKINEICEACCVKEITVWGWIAGRAKPNALARKTISSVLNIPESELFPEDNNSI